MIGPSRDIGWAAGFFLRPKCPYIPCSKQGLYLFIPGGEHPLARPASRKRIMPSIASSAPFYSHPWAYNTLTVEKSEFRVS
jgi:hypothetical protein